MRKLISVVFLALMALIQVHAQDSDLRSAPDLPKFKVTLSYSSANAGQGTITSTVASGSKVAYYDYLFLYISRPYKSHGDKGDIQGKRSSDSHDVSRFRYAG